MPNTLSAKKELTKNKRKGEINNRVRSRMKKFAKELTELSAKLEKTEVISKESVTEIEGILKSAYKAIDKAAKKGVIKKNNASRKKSSLAKKVNSIQKKSSKK